MKAVQDFNYKVALASGLKHLQAGKLRQAQEQFDYLIKKFPNAEGGYRGLARVQMQLADRAGAIGTLRDGAAALAKAGGRAVAIDLLRECIALDPHDLATHRRLAAALALAGDVSAAANEYVRFANDEIAAGNDERARLEAAYAIEAFGEIPALHDLATRVGLPLRTVSARTVTEPDPIAEHRADTELEPAPVVEDRAWRDIPEPPSISRAATPLADGAEQSDPFVLEARAMALISSRDPEAGQAAIEATRALAAAGKTRAASDLLLEMLASGIAVHDAERELVGVARAIGRGDIADERERLLGEAARLG